MRILTLHNRYQIGGGEDRVVQTEKALLEAKGHHVNLLEANNDQIANPLEKAKAAISAIYSSTAKQQVNEAIANFQPDIMHVHNFFPLFSHLCTMRDKKLAFRLCKLSTTIAFSAPTRIFSETERFARIA